MTVNPYIQGQLTKLNAQHEGKKKALEDQTMKWEKISRSLRAGLIVVRIVAASGCILPFFMLLFGASTASIGIAACIVSFLFVAALAGCGVLRVLSRLHEKRRSELANAYSETADMVTVMESLMTKEGRIQ